MKAEQKETFADLAVRVLKGRGDALHFLMTITAVLHLWDDLTDRDKPLNNDEIYDGFYKALIVLPRDPFYVNNFASLSPILEMAIYNWQIANQLEADGDEYALQIAFILRSAYSDLATMCARIVGGEEWARQVGVDIHRHWHNEGWAGYLDNLSREKAARS